MINNRQNGGRRRGRNGPRQQNGLGRSMNDGNRIDSRQRGNAHQLHEKYKALARDAQMQGDRVQAEYYLQFADHYFRLLAEQRGRQDDMRGRQREDVRDERDDDIEDDEGDEREIPGLPGPARVGADGDGNRAFGRDGANGADDGLERSARPRQSQSQRRPVEIRYDAEADDSASEAPPPRRRGRPPRVDAGATHEAATESPAAIDADADGEAPRRRGRPRRRPIDDAVTIDA